MNYITHGPKGYLFSLMVSITLERFGQRSLIHKVWVATKNSLQNHH